MSKENLDFLEDVYSNTLEGERIKKRLSIIHDYLFKYGDSIKNGKVKPTPVMERLGRQYKLSRLGVYQILRKAGIYESCRNPIIFPQQLDDNSSKEYGRENII